MATFPVTLLDDPRQQFRLFYRAALAAYGAACTTIYQHGLLGYIVTDNQWELLPGNSAPNANPALPNDILPRPTITIPPTPAATASALTIKIWERKLADNVLVTDNLRTLKTNLIASIQPADLVTLHDPFFGLLNVSALTIMTHITELHGTLNQADFAHLRSQLSLSMGHNESIQDFIGTHQLLHDQFAEAQQPLSELDKCHHFREAVKSLTHIPHAIDSYLVTHPLVGQQLYRELTTHVLQQAPNFTPTAASMGYAATASAPTNAQTEPSSIPTLLQSSAFAALLTAAIKQAAHDRRNRRNRSAAKKTPASDNRPYCFHHGYDSHHGVDCRYMSANAFSSDKRAATTHGTLTGASSNRL